MSRHVFLSFVEEDLVTVNLFRGQAKNRNSALIFDDYSVRTPYNSSDAAYIRSQIASKIRSASVTVCLIGTTTHKSNWVDWEIEKSHEVGNRLIGIKLSSTVPSPVPRALTKNAATVLGWDIPQIVRAIG